MRTAGTNDSSYDYRVKVYIETGEEGEDPETTHLNTYDYTGPVTLEPGEWYRWDRNQHTIDLGPIVANRVFGIVENQYGGSGPWYTAGGVEYELVQ